MNATRRWPAPSSPLAHLLVAAGLRTESGERPASAPATLAALRAERDRLRREIDDLRAFERDYRSRMIAYMEGELRKLRVEMPEGTRND